jgi:uncharacterized protein (DUF302 family)
MEQSTEFMGRAREHTTRKIIFPSEALMSAMPAAMLDNGMVHLSSSYSVQETLKRVQSILRERGLMTFCVVDHSGEAAKVGLKMHPTQLILFGPKAGTPVMVASPTIAIDLPLKALVWEDAGGKVWLSYNSPEYLQHRHGVPADLVKNISAAGPLLQSAIE